MVQAFNMNREQLTQTLEKLDNDFNRYAYLYAILEGNLLLQQAYSELKNQFNKKPEDFRERAVAEVDTTQRTNYAQKMEEIKQIRHQIDEANSYSYIKELVNQAKRNYLKMWKQSKAKAIILAIFTILLWFSGILLGALWTAAVIFFLGNKDDGQKNQKPEVPQTTYAELAKREERLNDKLATSINETQKEIWQAEYEKFCKLPENQELIEAAIARTQSYLAEFLALNFSNYQLFPAVYRDNRSLHDSLYFLQTGQASNWKDCAQLLAQQEFQQKQLAEVHNQTLNQQAMLNNQKEMINNQKQQLSNQQQMLINQQTQIEQLNDVNQNIQNLNKQIAQLSGTVRRHGVIQEAQMAAIIHKQSKEIFQAQRFHEQDLIRMQNSVKAITSSADYNTSYLASRIG